MKFNGQEALTIIPPLMKIAYGQLTTTTAVLLPGDITKLRVIQGYSISGDNTAVTTAESLFLAYKNFWDSTDKFLGSCMLTPSTVNHCNESLTGLNLAVLPGADITMNAGAAAPHVGCFTVFYTELNL